MVLAALVVRDNPHGFDLGGTAAVLAWVAVSLAVLSGGINDFIRVPDSKKLRALAHRFKDRNVRWDDIFASADTVPNGRLHEDETILSRSTQIINFGSPFRDHTTYWTNSDGFVSRVASTLLSYDSPPILAPLSEDSLSYLAQRRASACQNRADDQLDWALICDFDLGPLRR